MIAGWTMLQGLTRYKGKNKGKGKQNYMQTQEKVYRWRGRGYRRWRIKAANREEWSVIVREAKALRGL
jgi:hypothetical protein